MTCTRPLPSGMGPAPGVPCRLAGLPACLAPGEAQAGSPADPQAASGGQGSGGQQPGGSRGPGELVLEPEPRARSLPLQHGWLLPLGDGVPRSCVQCLGCLWAVGRDFSRDPSCSSRPKGLGPAQTQQRKAILKPLVGTELQPGRLPYQRPTVPAPCAVTSPRTQQGPGGTSQAACGPHRSRLSGHIRESCQSWVCSPRTDTAQPQAGQGSGRALGRPGFLVGSTLFPGLPVHAPWAGRAADWNFYWSGPAVAEKRLAVTGLLWLKGEGGMFCTVVDTRRSSLPASPRSQWAHWCLSCRTVAPHQPRAQLCSLCPATHGPCVSLHWGASLPGGCRDAHQGQSHFVAVNPVGSWKTALSGPSRSASCQGCSSGPPNTAERGGGQRLAPSADGQAPPGQLVVTPPQEN